jgi:hypothetical protein
MLLSSSSFLKSTYVAGFFVPLESSSFSFSARCDSSTSQSAAISTFGIADHARTWLEPLRPHPATAIRTVSLGLQPRTAAPPAITAVLIKKCLRFMCRSWKNTAVAPDPAGIRPFGIRPDDRRIIDDPHDTPRMRGTLRHAASNGSVVSRLRGGSRRGAMSCLCLGDFQLPIPLGPRR